MRAWTGQSRERGVLLCRKVWQCVGVSGSLFNRVRKPNRVVGGAVHPCASPSATERIQDWVLGGRAADTDRRSFEASRPHASRSQRHTVRGEPQARGAQQHHASVRSGVSRARARDQRAREARAWYTGGGDSHRASEVRSQLTRRCYQYVRGQVHCAPGEKQERQGKKKVLQRA